MVWLPLEVQQGVLSYISHIGQCAAPKGRVFAPFWSENWATDFAHFGLQSVMLFKGTTEAFTNVFIVSIPNE